MQNRSKEVSFLRNIQHELLCKLILCYSIRGIFKVLFSRICKMILDLLQNQITSHSIIYFGCNSKHMELLLYFRGFYQSITALPCTLRHSSFYLPVIQAKSRNCILIIIIIMVLFFYSILIRPFNLTIKNIRQIINHQWAISSIHFSYFLIENLSNL